MDIYSKLVEKVREVGREVRRFESLAGTKVVYEVKGYEIVVDTLPFRPSDLIVHVSKGGKPIYLSPSSLRGMARIGISLPAELCDPKILEKVYEDISGGGP